MDPNSLPRLLPLLRGDPFFFAIQLEKDGEVQPTNGASIASQIRDQSGRLVAVLHYTPNGDGSLIDGALQPVNPDTSNWPIGDLHCDIRITRAGIATHSPRFIVPVVGVVTHD